MQISVRSHLIAGTAAVVGASAIAMTPVLQHDLQLPALHMPSTSTIDVALAGFDSPVSEIFRTLGQVNTLIFGSGDALGDYPFIFNLAGMATIQAGYGFNATGIIPQIINDRLPIISQLGVNGSAYLDSSFNALYSIGYTLSEGVWNAAGEALTLNIPGAVNTLLAAVQTAGETALQSGQYVLNNVVAKASALLSAVPSLASLVVNSALGQAQVLVGAFAQVAQNVVAGLQAGDFEATWNAAVDGLFGPTGIPGVVNALTIGAGVQTDATTVVPSVRGVVQAAVKGVADALSVTAPSPGPVPPPAAAQSAAQSAAPSAAALRSAAAVESSSAEVTPTAGDEGSGSDSATPGDNANGGSETKSGSAKAGAKHGLGGSKRAAKASAGKSSD
ncbi:hypothetical protein ACXDF8_17770 [Mycolicibacterium sp. CBM1]